MALHQWFVRSYVTFICSGGNGEARTVISPGCGRGALEGVGAKNGALMIFSPGVYESTGCFWRTCLYELLPLQFDELDV